MLGLGFLGGAYQVNKKTDALKESMEGIALSVPMAIALGILINWLQ